MRKRLKEFFISKILMPLIKKLVTFYYRLEHFYAWSWGVNEHLDLYIISEESYKEWHRFGTRSETLGDLPAYIKSKEN